MKLPSHFVLTITGQTRQVREREFIVEQIGRMMAWLLCGNELEDSAFRGFHLTIDIDEDRDQCDEPEG